jgi:hypothetical protein
MKLSLLAIAGFAAIGLAAPLVVSILPFTIEQY